MEPNLFYKTLKYIPPTISKIKIYKSIISHFLTIFAEFLLVAKGYGLPAATNKKPGKVGYPAYSIQILDMLVGMYFRQVQNWDNCWYRLYFYFSQQRALQRRILMPQQLRILYYFWIRSKSIASKTCYGQKKPKISSGMFCLTQVIYLISRVID